MKLILRTLLMSCCAGLFFAGAFFVLFSEEGGRFLRRFRFAVITAAPGVVILYVEYVTWRHYLTKHKPHGDSTDPPSTPAAEEI